jgi:hypothetical protein
MEGYRVRISVKVELTKDEKRQIGPPSPRWELDIVAYCGRDNLLRIIECKGYLDSYTSKRCACRPSYNRCFCLGHQFAPRAAE